MRIPYGFTRTVWIRNISNMRKSPDEERLKSLYQTWTVIIVIINFVGSVHCWSIFDPFYIIDLYGFVQKQAKIQWYSNGSHVSFQNDYSITWGILYIHFLEKPLFATDWTRVVCRIRRGCDATRGPKSARGGTFVLSGRGKQSEGMKQRFPSCPHQILWFGWWFPGTTSICLFQSYQASCASGSHRIDN